LCGHELIRDKTVRNPLGVDSTSRARYVEDDDHQLNKELFRAKSDREKAHTGQPIEVPMEQTEVKKYYDQYMFMLKAQKQSNPNVTEEELHQIVVQLFESLQYKSEKAAGE
jgi:hypothetical protein